MGPAIKDQEIHISRVDRITHATQKAVRAYFEDPLYYLFYGVLTIVLVLVLCHVGIWPEIYGFLFVVGAMLAWRRRGKAIYTRWYKKFFHKKKI